ncbi:CHAP domain-containing protein [Varibaculum cambriense]|uniref:CHAP domain-containing protein n=1 Tax=Varibaculum cambriense TaxID=184870 RepID=UPI002904F511|nr:CHAP domain-containing protein [Varibaculum cambriense]MDU1225070.1 CHAP domain-containing protein [Varibaculum cambriense]
MATATQIISIAAREVGYSRWKDPQAGTKYGRWYAAKTGSPYFGRSGVPYCAMFVSWVLSSAGMTPPGGIFAYCPTGLANARRLGRTRDKRAAKPGDLVFFDWNKDGVSDHVGIVTANRGSYLETIEGNTSPGVRGSQSNGGGVYRRARSLSLVIGVVSPQYSGTSSPRPAAPSGLAVDGWAGKATIRRAQQLARTPQDGYISGQWRGNRKTHWAVVGIRYGRGGSMLVRKIQATAGVKQDGHWGPATTRAMQRRLGVTQDGYFGHASVKAWQRRLNAGRLI